MPGGSTHHQQSIWLEKVGKAVSLTYHDNIKRIYRKIAKKMPQCFACIRGVWGFIDRVTGSLHLRKAEFGLHESNTSKRRSHVSLNLLMSKKIGVYERPNSSWKLGTIELTIFKQERII